MLISIVLIHFVIAFVITFNTTNAHSDDNVKEIHSDVLYVSKLNLSAEIFCPTKNRNNISTINNFPININLIYSNLQGMFEGCHFDEFTNEIFKVLKNLHFIAISETWLRSGVNTNKSMTIPGFKVLRSDRRTSIGDRNKGGGVALFVKQNIKTKILMKSADNENNIENVEYIFVECLLNGRLFAIAVVYRTNSCGSVCTTNLFHLLIDLSSKYTDVIVVGDFNINILDSITRIKQLIDHFEIVNHFCPTHKWPNASPTLIDIVLTKNGSRVKFYGHYNLIPATHHDLIMVSYQMGNICMPRKSNFSFYDYEKIDENKLRADAAALKWTDLYHESRYKR